ncbi:hypothetical protein C347_06196 [Cryptococcus neoformans AD2-60a]|nr:hypothetical protein C347_06196 [Cryptococcus neoformans var. grubii AD2-60a]OXC81684.1 hypothetical protein C344_06090 [Cryptococcus neoformans var. grubii AD1-7a]OXH24020.1 hypothetical protein J005_06226 [Cryptococcus neoformans var. grubii]
MKSTCSPFVLNWGIIGCGWISSEFVAGLALLHDDVTDVCHSIAAVGSRDLKKAMSFIKDHCPDGGNAQQLGMVEELPEAVGSYEQVCHHERVDIIYIGTPNISHFPDALAALQAGKHCLLEKPATLNAGEWKTLSALAKDKSLFLMEAVWTRFLPLTYVLQEHLFVKKTIGDIHAVHADFSMHFLDTVPDSHRTLNPDLAGGPLLDLGPYIILVAILALYHHPLNELDHPKLSSTMMFGRTGCDLFTSINLQFPKLAATANLTTSFAYNTTRDVPARIIGSKGEILISGPMLSRMVKMTIRELDQEIAAFPTAWKEDVIVEMDFPGFGLHFEADAVARSLKAGELENSRMPHAETEMVMEIFDKIREDGGYKFPTEK